MWAQRRAYPPAPPVPQVRALIVESDVAEAEALERALTALPSIAVRCERVTRAREATHALRRRAFDVVLVDVCLPDARGEEAITVLNEWPDLVVLAFGTCEDALARCERHGGAQVVRGAGGPDVLATQIEAALHTTHYERHSLLNDINTDDTGAALVPGCLNAVVRELREQLGNLDLHLHVQPTAPVRADPSRVQVVLRQVLHAAVALFPRGWPSRPEVAVVSNGMGPWVRVSVRAVGVGIDDARLDLVLEADEHARLRRSAHEIGGEVRVVGQSRGTCIELDLPTFNAPPPARQQLAW